MTNWDNVKKATTGLFVSNITPRDFAKIVASPANCSICGIEEMCDKCMYETNQNGNFILDDDGDRVFKNPIVKCEDVIEKWLNQEVNTNE